MIFSQHFHSKGESLIGHRRLGRMPKIIHFFVGPSIYLLKCHDLASPSKGWNQVACHSCTIFLVEKSPLFFILIHVVSNQIMLLITQVLSLLRSLHVYTHYTCKPIKQNWRSCANLRRPSRRDGRPLARLLGVSWAS